MRKSKYIKYFVYVIVLLLIGLNYYPVKQAVRELPSYGQDYILVEQERSTLYDWHIVGDKENKTNLLKGVILHGDAPKFEFPGAIYEGKNTFICFGEYDKDVYMHGEWCKVFNVDSWDIMYPVKRVRFLPDFMNPKYGMNIWDFYDTAFWT